MATKAKPVQSETQGVQSLTAFLSTKMPFHKFTVWLVGDTPLITHAWSEKAKREMLQKQVKAVRSGREERNPQADFVSSLYDMGDGKSFGFPVTGVKNCILSAAHKDKGIARDHVMRALWLRGEIVSVRPALAGAVCDMPLIRIWGGDPEMREDMVKIGKGLSKVASLAYRGQFRFWAMRIEGQYNSAVLNPETLAFLIQESGLGSGLGEWRNERKGIFGSFHLASANEEAEWEAFRAGGELPVPEDYRMAAE